ncbi:DUF4296 domain-containing protein [Rufibacter latericius]|uniref:DUF4296 domain-containing protein n=1 Tax=Rufibacter latericius TaxID=2487040 RepID=A0A3M9MJG7_9BACT|nr:DUF4296 domain-containing protein [Rufibacter latericius]
MCLLLLPLVLLACTPEQEKPADLITEEKMARIMIDVHLTEAAIARTIHHFDSSRAAYRAAHKQILKRQGVSDSAFKHSYDFYLSNPATLDKIYEIVLDSLSLREAKMTAQVATTDSTTTLEHAPEAVPDTIKAKTKLSKFKRISVPDSLKGLQKKRMIK